MRARRWRRRLLGAGVLLLGGVAVIWFLQRMVLFPRHLVPLPEHDVRLGVAGLKTLTLATEEGAVEAFYLPGEGVSAERPGPAVIFAHGNGELIDFWLDLARVYRAMGLSVLLPEYRGYGRSAGTPSQAAITADFVAFQQLLAARPEVDPSRLVYHGRSLGGGAVCALAAQRPPRALILMSTFTSVRRMARRYLVPGPLIRDPFDNLSVVRAFGGPLLLAHGRQDEVVPFAHAEALQAAHPGARLLAYDQAGHNNCPPRWEPFWQEVRRFLGEAGVLAGE